MKYKLNIDSFPLRFKFNFFKLKLFLLHVHVKLNLLIYINLSIMSQVKNINYKSHLDSFSSIVMKTLSVTKNN